MFLDLKTGEVRSAWIVDAICPLAKDKSAQICPSWKDKEADEETF